MVTKVDLYSSYHPEDHVSAMLNPPTTVKPNKCNVSIQILYPLLFTLLLIASLGVNIILATMSHLNTVATLVEDVHTEVGSRMVRDITVYFDVAANMVGDHRAAVEAGLLDPYLKELDDPTTGNGNYKNFGTLYLRQHPEITTTTIANEQNLVMYVDTTTVNEAYTLNVRNSTTNENMWTLDLDRDGNYVNESNIVQVQEQYFPTTRVWYYQPRANPRSRTGAVWSEPFMWFDKSNIGMFCAGFITNDANEPIALVGADIVVSNLQQFFGKIGLRGGSAFAISADGGVFSSSLPDVVFTEEGPDETLMIHKLLDKLDSEKHSSIIKVAKTLQERIGSLNWVNLTLSDTIHDNAVYIAPINDQAQSGLHLLVMLPLGPFRDEVEGDVIVSTLIAVALLVASAVAAIAFSVGMTRPLSRATATLNRCAELDVEGLAVGTRSWVKEIASLQDSTASLLAALRSFALYIPRGVVHSLMINKKAAVAEMEAAELGIFFCDIANFTDISHKLSAMDTSRLLATYFSMITNRLEESGATTDKFLGDGVLAFWGAPAPVLNRSKNALETILRIEEDIRRHRKRSATGIDSMPTPGLRIGIHDGPCLVGNIGTATRLNYTVIGDAVNLASRLESLSKHFKTSHLVSDRVVEGCANDFVTRRVARVTVKGRTEPTTVMNVLARSTDSSDVVARARSLQSLYESALDQFIKGDFISAGRAFRHCLSEFPEDGPSEVMSEMSEEYSKKVPDNWRGFIAMDTK